MNKIPKFYSILKVLLFWKELENKWNSFVKKLENLKGIILKRYINKEDQFCVYIKWFYKFEVWVLNNFACSVI